MLLARVEGNVVATRKHPSLEGWRLLVCQPIGLAGDAEGAPQVAIDAHGAGMHQRVIISSDGAAARNAVGNDKSPVRWMVVGIVDEKEFQSSSSKFCPAMLEGSFLQPEIGSFSGAWNLGFGVCST